jgi:hypothetical protein
MMPNATFTPARRVMNLETYVTALRRCGAHVVEVHNEDGTTAFIVNNNPNERISVRADGNMVVVRSRGQEADSVVAAITQQFRAQGLLLEPIQLDVNA